MTAIKGTKKAQVYPVFSDRLQQLQADAGKQADGFKGTGQRVWQVPEAIGDLFDIPSLHMPTWDRDDLNLNYVQCMDPTSPGTTGDIIGLKLQIDYLAMEERAFRLRHASLCRNFAHAMGRRNGLAVSRIYPAISDAVSNAIAKGAVGTS